MKDKRSGVCKCVETFWSNSKLKPNLLKRVVTGDESWIFEYDPLTKRQSLEWKSALSPKPQKARMFKSKTKVMLQCWAIFTIFNKNNVISGIFEL